MKLTCIVASFALLYGCNASNNPTTEEHLSQIFGTIEADMPLLEQLLENDSLTEESYEGIVQCAMETISKMISTAQDIPGLLAILLQETPNNMHAAIGFRNRLLPMLQYYSTHRQWISSVEGIEDFDSQLEKLQEELLLLDIPEQHETIITNN